jgi:CHAT domain-containing protein/tetratricopeptide (TPR) repeat protein
MSADILTRLPPGRFPSICVGATLMSCLLIVATPLLLGQQLRKRTDPVERTSREGQPALVLTEQQKATLKERDRLLFQALALAQEGKWVEARAAIEKSLELLRQVHDEPHPEFARTWQVLGELHVVRGDFPAARQAFEELVRLQRKRLGRGHWQTTDAELRLAHIVFLEQATPATRAELANAYQLLTRANAESARSDFRKAEELYRQALAIFRSALGEENQYTAHTWGQLASALTELGKHAEAEKVHRHTLALSRRILGPEHPNTVVSLANLASDLTRQGKNAEAEALDRQALEIHRRVLGDNDPKTAQSLNALAVCLRNQGRFAEAENLLRQALGIQTRLPGQEHDTAISFNNLAQILFEQGKTEEAEQLNRAALAMYDKLKRHKHPHRAIILQHLAIDLRRQGKHAEAEKLHREALAIVRDVLGDDHIQTADTINNLARLLLESGQLAEGEKLFHEALAIYRKVGEENISYADSLRYLAAVFFYQARFAESAQSVGHALNIFRKVLGEEHPETAQCLGVLALARHADGDVTGAQEAAQRGAKAFLSVRPHISFAGLDRGKFSQQSPLAFLAALQARHNKPREAWQTYEQFLGRGLFDDLAARTSRPLTVQERAREETLLGQLALIDKRLSGLSAANRAKEADQLRGERDQVLLEMTGLQSELAERYGVVAGEVYDLSRIQRQLSPDSALVAWLDIDGHAKAKDPGGEHWGLVLRRDGAPNWVKLTGAGPQGSWSDRDRKIAQSARQLLQNPSIDPAIDWQAELDDLAKQRLGPLLPHLDGVKRLVVLPSVAMAGIPLGAVTDDFTVSYAPSGSLYAWLLENRQRNVPAPDSLLALADPVFSEQQLKVASATRGDGLARLLRGVAPRPLPGTRREVEAIAGLFTSKGRHVQTFLGEQANGLNLDRLAGNKELARFRYLHLATHGYPDPSGGMNSYLALTPEDLAVASHSKLTAGHMLRTWKLNAELVTLSACETALGEYQAGEGYVGFAQALLLAGARSLVLSQWPADDRATTLLMRRFYQNLLGERPGLPAPMVKVEALAEAKRWLRGLTRQEVIDQLQTLQVPFQPGQLAGERPFEHPFFWAPFILIGDPGFSGDGG